MTIIPAEPTMSGAVATGIGLGAGSSDATAAGDFLAAILQALAPAGAESTPDTTAPAPDAPAADAAALGLVVPAVLAGQLAAAATPPSVVTAPVESTAAAAGAGAGAGAAAGAGAGAGHANVAHGAGGAPTDPSSDIRMSAYAATPADSPALPDPALGDPARAGGHANVADGADGSHSGPASDIRMSVSAATTTATPDRPAAAGSVTPDGGPDRQADTADLPAQPVAGTPTGPAPVTTSTPATGTAAAQHVGRQVFPEVTSLVTRGDGTHRITLTLKPEALGEVRVVMTVRDGSVHVRLAAGQEAQHALLDGTNELTRLLEAAGATHSRIVVRDLPTASPGPTDAPDLGTGGQPTSGQHQDQHAGTRAHEQPATDGTYDGTRHRRIATGATSPRSNEPVTHTRAAGVDVTM